VYALIFVGLAATLYPIVYMVAASFEDTAEIFSVPPQLLPPHWRISNYTNLFEQWPYLRWYANTLYIAIARVVLSCFLCSLGGYAFAKFNFSLRNPLFIVVLATMMMPFHVVLIPLFELMVKIGWVDTSQAMIGPWVASAFGIFMMRQYLVNFPPELIEAARIDGVSEFGIYWRIVVPLSAPGLAALAIVMFVFTWTAYLWPLIVLRSTDSYTLSVGLNSMLASLFSSATSAPILWGQLMAGATLATIPIIAVFVLMQRFFILGSMSGGVKG
jgi:ABC-type glycerol-3-phosphate transport system permease component